MGGQDDRSENKKPLTGDAVPVTRLLTTRDSFRARDSNTAHQFHLRGRQSFRTTQPTRLGCLPAVVDGSYALLCLRQVQQTDHDRV